MLTPIRKIKIRHSKGPSGGWRLVLDGDPKRDKYLYDSFEKALKSAIFRLRRRAVENLFDDLMNHTPKGEYVGLRATHVHGADLRLKRQNIALQGKKLHLRLGIEIEDDGGDGHIFYVRLLGGKR
jgi:hypothetical protein